MPHTKEEVHALAEVMRQSSQGDLATPEQVIGDAERILELRDSKARQTELFALLHKRGLREDTDPEARVVSKSLEQVEEELEYLEDRYKASRRRTAYSR